MPEENKPIFQVPSQAVEMKTAIHFYDERKTSILLDVNSTGATRNFCEVQFFAFYLIRQLATLGNPEDDALAQMLLDISSSRMRLIAGDIGIIPYAGYDAKKQLFANCTLHPDTSSFYFNTKGFGLLGYKIGYYSPASVLVFLQTLALRHADEESYLVKLRDACRLSAIFHLSKQLTMANQSEMAFMIGGTLLSESTLDD